MKSPNKIRERDIDDDFLLSLKTGIGITEAQQLLMNYIRRDEIINAGQLPIEDLKRLLGLNNEETLDSLLHTLITVILKLIGDNQGKYNVKIVYNGSSYAIKIVGEDNEEHDVIAYSKDIDNTENTHTDISNGITSEEVTRMVTDLQNQIDYLKTKLSQVKSAVETSGTSYDTLYENIINEMNIKNAELSSKVDSCENTIRELQRRISVLEEARDTGDTITMAMLSQDIIDKLDKIDELQSEMISMNNGSLHVDNMKAGQVLHCIDDNFAVEGRDLIIFATICTNADELAQAQSDKKELIIDTSNGISYEYDSENDKYNEKSFIGNHKNDNVFICDTDTDNIRFVVLNDKFIEFTNNGSYGNFEEPSGAKVVYVSYDPTNGDD